MSPAPESPERSFDDLVQATTPSLYRFALSIVRRPEVAEELVQETYLRAWTHRTTIAADSIPVAWLRSTLHNAAVDRVRKDRHEILAEDVERDWARDEFTVDADEVVAQASDRLELEDALVHVPFIYRAAVVLHDVEGYTTREIAAFASVGEPAVKQRLRRGRMMLVSALAAAGKRRVAMKGVPMRCWDARQKISDYLNDALDAPTRSLVEAHLRVCPTCPPLVASLVGVRAQLGALRDSDSVVPPRLAERIVAAMASSG